MQFWVLLLASNALSLLVLIQALLSKDKERLAWLRRRALICVWMAFVGAAVAVGFAIWAINAGAPVTPSMYVILYALLLMLLPLVTRTIVNARVGRFA